MDAQVQPKPRLLTRTRRRRASKPERVEAIPMQEQFTGPLPVGAGRPAAELLAERVAESNPADMSPVFIP